MDKVDQLRKKATEALFQMYYNDANWRLHLAYLMADVLSSHFKYAMEDLEFMDKSIKFNDRYHVRTLLKLMRSVQFHAEALYKQSIVTGGESESYIFESWSLIFQTLFLKVLSVCGTDQRSNIRLYNLYKKLDKYPQLINPRELKDLDNQAWGYLKKLIEEGKITKDQIDEVFESSAKGSSSKGSKGNS